MDIDSLVDGIGRVIDLAGVAAIVIGASAATVAALVAVAEKRDRLSVYRSYRSGLGRSILLGLELLVAADIVRTVAVTPSIESVMVLGAIVLVRTFLSFGLEVELEGRLPWRRRSPHGRIPDRAARIRQYEIAAVEPAA